MINLIPKVNYIEKLKGNIEFSNYQIIIEHKYEKAALEFNYKVAKRLAVDESTKPYFFEYVYNKNLKEQEYSYNVIDRVIEELVAKNIVDDLELAKQQVTYLARNGNGPLLIKEKLKFKLFSSETINIALETIDEEDYHTGKEKLIKSLKKRYKDDEEKIQEFKIKKQLYNHGY